MTRATLRQWIDRVQTSYWYVPAIMAVLALLLARAMIWLDNLIPNEVLLFSPLIYTGTSAETRTSMVGLAGSVLGTAGIVFSLMTLPMSVAASQFGSRLLRIYLRDRTTQLILGAFAGTFVYCVTVALSIPSSSQNREAPQLASTMALLLTLGVFFSLIALIHHMGTSLEAPNVIAAASRELQEVIDLSWSTAEEAAEATRDEIEDGNASPASAEPTLQQFEQNGVPIYATRMGYIQAIDPEVILPLARKHNFYVRLVSKPGSFVRKGELVALVYPPQNVVGRVADNIRDCYLLGNLRTPTQDFQYAINQLVEMALRAMSAAINDPYTAITCLDHLGAGLSLYIEQIHRHKQSVELAHGSRIIFERVTLAEFLDGTFHMLRRASREMPDVLLAMLASLDVIGQQCTNDNERAEVIRHIQLVQMESDASTAIALDKQRIIHYCEQLVSKYGTL